MKLILSLLCICFTSIPFIVYIIPATTKLMFAYYHSFFRYRFKFSYNVRKSKRWSGIGLEIDLSQLCENVVCCWFISGVALRLALRSLRWRCNCPLNYPKNFFWTAVVSVVWTINAYTSHKINASLTISKTFTEDGQILAVQCNDPDTPDAFLHVGGPLAGLHLVCDRREGNGEERWVF